MPQKTFKELKIRIPVQMKQWLSIQAEANSRSMNGEIIAILKAVMRAATANEKR